MKKRFDIENLIFTSFMAILAFIALLFIYFNTSKDLNIIRKNQNLKAVETNSSINKKLDFLMTTLHASRTDEHINEYLNSYGNDYVAIVSAFYKLKKTNNIYSSLGYNFAVLKEDSDIVITLNGTRNKNDFFKSYQYDEEAINKNIITLKDKGNNLSLSIKNKNFLENNGFIWFITLEKELFFSELNTIDSNNWFIFSKGQKLTSLNNCSVDSSTIASIENYLSSEEKFEEKQVKIDGKNVYLSHCRNLDVKLIHVLPDINIFQIILLESLKVFTLLGILGVASYFIFKIMSKQFLEMKNKEFILENKIKTKDFLLGIENSSGSELLPALEIMHKDSVRLLILEILDLDAFSTNYEEVKASKKYITKYFESMYEIKLVDIDYKSSAFILGDKKSSEIEELFTPLLDEIEEKFNIQFVAAVSEKGKTTELDRMYKICKRILDYKFVFKSSRMLFEEKINTQQLKSSYYPVEIEARLISKALNGNALAAKKVIDEIFNDKVQHDSMSRDKIREFSTLLYNTLNRIILQLQDFCPEKKLTSINTKKIIEIKDLTLLKESFLSLILDICKLTKGEEQKDIEIIKLKIQTYLEENHMRDISLENVSDYLGHSLKYTSILFKKVIGDNFKNYLTLYRIQKAKDIMKDDSSIKIKTLAEMVGYNSSNTFIRIFKKYEGISPGKYFELEEE